MSEENERLRSEASQEPVGSRRGGEWAIIVAGALALGLVVSLMYGWHERNASRDLADNLALQRQDMNDALSQARSQIDALAAKVNALSQPAQPPALAAPASKTHSPARRSRPVEDRRLRKLQEQVAAQQKQLDTTEQNLEQARTELTNNLSSTKDELDGSIAKTHDELVALEKKGERNYYEFDLDRSKAFKRVGSLSLSLRKINARHDYFDLAMIVDDSRLDKKHVNLYEPVVVYPEDSSRPLELVANRIDKNGIHGYVSEPKYQETASASTSAGEAVTPAGSITKGWSSPAGTDNSQGKTDSSPANTTDLPHRPSPER